MTKPHEQRNVLGMLKHPLAAQPMLLTVLIAKLTGPKEKQKKSEERPTYYVGKQENSHRKIPRWNHALSKPTKT